MNSNEINLQQRHVLSKTVNVIQMKMRNSSRSLLVLAVLLLGVLSPHLSFAGTVPAPLVSQCLRIDGAFGETGYWLTEQETLDAWGSIARTRYPDFTVDYLTPVPPGTYPNGNIPYYCNTYNTSSDHPDGVSALLEKVRRCQYRTVAGDVNLGSLQAEFASDGSLLYYCTDSEPVDPKNNGCQCPKQDTDEQFVGNPINVGTGNKVQIEGDYVGRRLQFTRTYNSKGQIPNTALGPMWTHNFQLRIDFIHVNPTMEVSLQRGDGRLVRFRQSGANWVGDADNTDQLVRTVNGQGVPTGWELTTSTAVEKYAATGEITEIAFRTGEKQTFFYSDTSTLPNIAPFPGMLVKVQSSFGDSLQFHYDRYRRITELIDPAGGTTGFSYAADRSLLMAVTYPDGNQKKYHYGETSLTSGANLPFALTGITDENNVRFANFEFDVTGRGIATEHAGGVNRYTISYVTGQANVVTPAQVVKISQFTQAAGLYLAATQSQPAGPGHGPATRTWDYDANGNRIRRADFNGNVTTYVYDLVRNLETSRTEAFGTPNARAIATQWHPTYRLPMQIDEPGRRTTYSYDPNGNLLSQTVLDTATSQSRTTTYTYNTYGQVLTIDGPRTDVNDVTTYTYYTCTTGYECGQVHTITDALSHTTTFNTYNAHGQPLTITDGNGVMTTMTYDSRQRLKSRSTAGETTSFDYTATGLLEKVTMPDLSFVTYTYDAAHRLTQIQDNEGNKIVYTLDPMGNRTKEEMFDPSNTLTQTSSQVFDTLNRLYQVVASANTAAVTTSFGYDADGNQTSINAPLGRNSTNAYDELNRLKSTTDPLSGVTQYGYNPLDQLISVTDPKNLTTAYTYNALGDLTQQVSPDTGTTNNTFDSGGNLKTTTDARNLTATYNYDALNRVTQVTYPDQTINFTYDTTTNGVGRLSSLTDASGSTGYTYTAQGRVASKLQVMGGVSKSVAYDYNTAGQLSTVTTPSGKTITYTYANGKIASVLVNGIPMATNVQYEPFGPVGGWTWGNGSLAVRVFDTDGKVTHIDSAGLNIYGYDDAFRITSITDTVNTANSSTFDYDALDRLTIGTKTGQSQTFTYDANGNRQTQGGTTSSTFTNSTTSNRLSSVSGALSKTYQYDNAGNTTSDGTITYSYNNAGRMTSSTKAGVTTNYTYNALGQRVTKTTAGVTTYFVYDEAGHLLGEYDQTGSLIEEIVWLYDTPIATIREGSCGMAIFYIHTDHLNTPRKITKRSTPDIVWRWDSDAFGSTQANENPSGLGTFAFNLRFPGQYFDSETGLYYNWNRYYDPQSGRYITSDPIGLADGTNTYAYVGGNPISYLDPLGLAATCGNPDRCAQLRKQMFAKMALLIKELSKYDPVADGRGGFPMKWGSGFTKPGGHFKEIAALQAGLKNDIAEYKRLCSNDGGWRSVPRSIDEAANRPVPEPVIPTPSPNPTITPQEQKQVAQGLTLAGVGLILLRFAPALLAL